MLSGRKDFWGSDRGGHMKFQVKCVSGCEDLILRNGDGLNVGEGSHKMEKSRACHLDLLSQSVPWE